MNEPQFLNLKRYKRKRITDAAKILPVLGAVTVLFPLPFLFMDPAKSPEGGPGATLLALYFFGVWLVLIVAGMILARILGRPTTVD